MGIFNYQYKVHPNAFTLWTPTHAVLNPFSEMLDNPYLNDAQMALAKTFSASSLAKMAEDARRTSSVHIARAMEAKGY